MVTNNPTSYNGISDVSDVLAHTQWRWQNSFFSFFVYLPHFVTHEGSFLFFSSLCLPSPYFPLLYTAPSCRPVCRVLMSSPALQETFCSCLLSPYRSPSSTGAPLALQRWPAHGSDEEHGGQFGQARHRPSALHPLFSRAQERTTGTALPPLCVRFRNVTDGQLSSTFAFPPNCALFVCLSHCCLFRLYMWLY